MSEEDGARKSRQRQLPRSIALLRALGFALYLVGESGMRAKGELSADAIMWHTLVGVVYAVVTPLVAWRIDPGPRSAQRSLLFDLPVYAWAAETSGFSLPTCAFLAGATGINFATNFGIHAVVPALVAVFGFAAVLHRVLATPVSMLSHSVEASILFLAGTVAYGSLIGGTLHREARRVARLRRELRSLTATLETRVAERTAALASTNAAIQRFVPREFLSALGHDDVTTTKLGDATAKSITVLFADIRNFTSSSEGMTAEETFAFLNGCLSKLGPHVRAQSGFVDKYIGDAIMALFPRDSVDAVRAAIAMQAEVRRSNESIAGREPLAVGVGIHVGRVMMGTIGEAERFEATVISDAVNLTARLESLTKQLGCSVLISEDVFESLDAELRKHTRRLGTFVVKGKATPVSLYEVFDSDSDALRAAKLRTRARFDAMLVAFKDARVDEALAIASELREGCPDDGPANWWCLRLMKESEAGEDVLAAARGIVRLDEK